MLELEHGFRVVDVRARLDPDEAVAESRGRAIGPDRLERELLQAGVVRALVSPGQRPPGEGYLRANNSVARLSVERPFLTVARLDGPLDPTNSPVSQLRNLTARRADHHATPEDVEQYAYDDRFHAFRLAPAVDGLPQADVLDELGKPVVEVVDPLLDGRRHLVLRGEHSVGDGRRGAVAIEPVDGVCGFEEAAEHRLPIGVLLRGPPVEPLVYVAGNGDRQFPRLLACHSCRLHMERS